MHTDTIGYKIRLLHNQIHKRMEAKRQENEKEPLTGMQRWTLGFLRDHDGKDIYQKDIETEFSVSRATASNMLAVMERKGLVRREAVEHDARLKTPSITTVPPPGSSPSGNLSGFTVPTLLCIFMHGSGLPTIL